MSPLAVAAYASQTALSLVGCVLLWRHVLSKAARANRAESPMPKWDPQPVQFVIFLGLLFACTFLFAMGGSTVVKHFHLTGDAAIVAAGTAAQIGMLAGVVAYALTDAAFRAQFPLGLRRILVSGVATFLILLPIVHVVSILWGLLLTSLGLPMEPQDLVRMFAEAKSGWMLALLIVVATVVAPMAEESVFRGGLYRFLLSRLPHSAALMVPALIFASLHVNWTTYEGFSSWLPLMVLAVVFSLAYRRTGNIGTTIVAHGLFNLNTILLIFCGITS
jgi:membrane protease YdiL (CAAX protease family)